MKFIIKLIISAVAVLAAAHFLPGVSVTDLTTAFVVAIVLGLLNTVLKPILVFFTLPITFMTLGLFLIIINAVIVWITAYFVSGFAVDGLLSAILFGFLQSIVTYILELFLGAK